MKKHILPLLLAVFIPFASMAQGAGSTAQTVITESLSVLPAKDPGSYKATMGKLAATGSEGIVKLASMLGPAESTDNNIVEYAIDGVTEYVSAPGREAQRRQIVEGLKKALEQTNDNPNRAFLMTMLQRTANASDAPFFVKYLNDSYLSDWAINGLITIPGTEATLLGLIKEAPAPSETLANAAARKQLRDAEPYILKWASSVKPADARAYYKALAEIGTSKSLPLLAKQAKAINYGWQPNGATEDYTLLLGNMVKNGEAKQAAGVARKLMKATDRANVRGAALNVIFAAEGEKALPLLLQAMNDKDRAYRANALKSVNDWADKTAAEEALGKIAKAKGDSDVKADIINWFGFNGVKSQTDAVLANLGSENPLIASAAIKAAGKLGGEDALNALVGQIGGPNSDEAMAALLAFNGNIYNGVMKLLNGNESMQSAGLKLASARQITDAAPKVFQLLNSPMKEAAYNALPGVVSPKDFQSICALVEQQSANPDPNLEKALIHAIRNNAPSMQYQQLSAQIKKSRAPQNYFTALAITGTPEAINELIATYNNGNGASKEAALNALLEVNSPEMINVLYKIASADKSQNARIMKRYASLVANSGYNNVRKYQLYRKGLEIAGDAATANTLLQEITSTGVYPALLVADRYFADAATAHQAAETVRTLVSKNNFGGAAVRKSLDNARKAYQAGGTADDGYMIKNIDGMLEKLPENGYFAFVEQSAVEPLAVYTVAGKDHSIFNGQALKGKDAKKAKKEAKEAVSNWKLGATDVAYSGSTPSLITVSAPYSDFELIFEWKGDGILGVRSIPAVNLNNGYADGEWNSAYVKVEGNRITLVENGETVFDNASLKAPFEGMAVPEKGAILLGSNGQPLEIRDILIKNLSGAN